MGIKEKNGYLYSLYEFDDYKFRAKFVVEIEESQLINTDVYTTNENRSEVENLLTNSVMKKYKVTSTDCKIVHWSSKEQDDLTTKLIEETLKDI